MFGYIYETVNQLNGKRYIGKKESTKFVPTYYGSGLLIKKAIKKYGKENFKVKLIKTCNSESELNIAESKLINKLKPEYNIASGGTGGNTTRYHSVSVKKQMFNKRGSAIKKWWASISDERKIEIGAHISQSKKGIIPNRIGYTHSESVKKQISLSNKKSAKTRPASWRENHRLAMNARRGVSNSSCWKPIELDGIKYSSIKEACEKLKISRPTLYKRLRKLND